MKVIRDCICGNQFQTTEKRLSEGRGKFCSKKCQYANPSRPSGLKYTLHKVNPTSFVKNDPRCVGNKHGIGRVPWNKGLKGIHLSPKSEFKKGSVPWSKGIIREDIRNEKHPNWKGDEVGNGALHTWVQRKKGRLYECEWCHKKGSTDFANLDNNYTRDLDTWAELCRSCHLSYDRKNGWGQGKLHWGGSHR